MKTMKVLIFEDEEHTAKMLIKLLEKYDKEIEILDVLTSVSTGIEWFKNNPFPDLIFQDIRLSDGDCFEIYSKTDVKTPVIFTTAYSKYALKSFDVNNIDYLLKPYDFGDLKRAMEKFKSVKAYHTPIDSLLLKDSLTKDKIIPKQRLLVKTGENYTVLKCEDVACFISEDGYTFAITKNNKRHIIDDTLSHLITQLDSSLFFLINRSTILKIDSVKKITQWFNGRLKLSLNLDLNQEVFVSRDRSRAFKTWLGG